MSKLLKRAIVDLEDANNNYNKIGVDDAYLDKCCYNLQQSIEKTLKFIVEMNGADYVENHDIRAQLNKLQQLNVSVPHAKDLIDYAKSLYSEQSVHSF